MLQLQSCLCPPQELPFDHVEYTLPGHVEDGESEMQASPTVFSNSCRWCHWQNCTVVLPCTAQAKAAAEVAKKRGEDCAYGPKNLRAVAISCVPHAISSSWNNSIWNGKMHCKSDITVTLVLQQSVCFHTSLLLLMRSPAVEICHCNFCRQIGVFWFCFFVHYWSL